MTRNHSRKSDIRKAIQPGEAFNAAALRLQKAEDKGQAPLPRVITAHVYQGSYPQKLHALIDSPAKRDRMGYGNLVISGRALCGSRGGSIENGGWRLVSAEGDNVTRHSGVDYAPDGDRDCKECTITWRAQFQPDEEDTKVCAGCNQALPTNKFRPNKARKDGLAAECEDCRRKNKWEAKLEKEAAQRDLALSSRRKIASDWLQRVKDWQESPYLKPFSCPTGHVLVAEILDRGFDVGLGWRCPCGSSVISRAEFKVIEAMEAVARHATGNPLTVSVS